MIIPEGKQRPATEPAAPDPAVKTVPVATPAPVAEREVSARVLPYITVCTPTYIGASIGMTMPKFKTVAAKVLRY